MKAATSELLAVSAWGLHLTSFIVASIPYLQVTSLLLAIVVSLYTLKKLTLDLKNRRNSTSDEKIP